MSAIQLSEGNAKTDRQIVGLDVLRILAALMVVALHYGFSMWLPLDTTKGVPIHRLAFLSSYVNFGWIGVQIFFVLSGFVIAYSAYASSAAKFMNGRLRRLLPSLFLCASFTALLTYWCEHASGSQVVSLWRNSLFFRPGGPYIDGSYWTLTIEMSFYLVCFVLLLTKAASKLTYVMAALSCVSLVYNGCMFLQIDSPSGLSGSIVHVIQKTPLFQAELFRYSCYFTFGIYLWLSLQRRFTTSRIAVLALCAVSALCEIQVRTHELSNVLQTRLSAGAPMLVWGASIVFMIVSFRINPMLHIKLSRRSRGLIRRAGLMTYPLYLIHQNVGRIMMTHLFRYLGEVPSLSVTILFVLLFAYATAVYIEPPLQRALPKWWASESWLNVRAVSAIQAWKAQVVPFLRRSRPLGPAKPYWLR